MSTFWTPKRLLFKQYYLTDLNGAKAAVRAGYSSKSAARIAFDLLDLPEMKAAIEEAKLKRLEALGLNQADILQDLIHVARADPRDLCEFRRGACRYCHGEGFKFQRTPAEFDRAVFAHMNSKEGREGAVFDMGGGVGFNPKRDPHKDCPECFGEGEGYHFIKDSRTLSPAAAKLFAGLKVTKDGIEIKTHSQDKARELAGRHVGLWGKGVDDEDQTPGEIMIHGGLPE